MRIVQVVGMLMVSVMMMFGCANKKPPVLYFGMQIHGEKDIQDDKNPDFSCREVTWGPLKKLTDLDKNCVCRFPMAINRLNGLVFMPLVLMQTEVCHPRPQVKKKKDKNLQEQKHQLHNDIVHRNGARRKNQKQNQLIWCDYQ